MNDSYKSMSMLQYLLSYLDSYIESYRDLVNYKENTFNTDKMNIVEIYELTHENFYINTNNTQFRTK